ALPGHTLLGQLQPGYAQQYVQKPLPRPGAKTQAQALPLGGEVGVGFDHPQAASGVEFDVPSVRVDVEAPQTVHFRNTFSDGSGLGDVGGPVVLLPAPGVQEYGCWWLSNHSFRLVPRAAASLAPSSAK